MLTVCIFHTSTFRYSRVRAWNTDMALNASGQYVVIYTFSFLLLYAWIKYLISGIAIDILYTLSVIISFDYQNLESMGFPKCLESNQFPKFLRVNPNIG